MTFLEKAWYSKAGWLIVLWPVSLLFQALVSVRRFLQQSGDQGSRDRPPVIVVGNLTLGGTGKTPTLIGLAKHFKLQGFKPGIISRGYGGKGTDYPLAVDIDSAVSLAGDEPVLIAGSTDCPVVVDPDRLAALDFLIDKEDIDIVLSDDGLQHYSLPRDVEICVVDGRRLFGNGWCLPAGPLREPLSRLRRVDFIVINGDAAQPLPQLQDAATLRLEPKFLVNLVTDERKPFSGAPFNIGNRVQAVSAIGNPQRFYEFLETLPYRLEKFSFPDHHLFVAEDFDKRGIDRHQPIVMTEKDAVKCRSFARNNFWYLSADVELPQTFLDSVTRRVNALRKTG